MLKAIYPDWHYHFVGIGGIGVSALAQIYADLGYRVSGSDRAGFSSAQLTNKNITIHQANEIPSDCDLVVLTRAIAKGHELWPKLEAIGKPWMYRGTFLAHTLHNQYSIAVCGTHGKTTTTSLLAEILLSTGRDPSVILGGISARMQANYRIGRGPVVVEADESDASFLELSPTINVITNIDKDHLQTYNSDFAALKSAFKQFSENKPLFGHSIASLNVAKMLDINARTFAIDDEADYTAKNVQMSAEGMLFDLVHAGITYRVMLPMYGFYNVENALAAIAAAHAYGISLDEATSALSQYLGVKRRLEYHGQHKIGAHSVELFEDYGHHPAEIDVCLRTLKQRYADRQVICVFEPHRYTRTVDLFEEFVDVLSVADLTLITPIYSAGELEVTICHTTLSEAVNSKGNSIALASLDSLAELESYLTADAVVILQGAGPLATKLTRQNVA